MAKKYVGHNTTVGLVSAWGYVGYSFLYSIPVIGFIILLVHALSGNKSKVNRRNYARSFFCALLLAIIIIGILIALVSLGVFGEKIVLGDITDNIAKSWNEAMENYKYLLAK